MRTNVLRTDAHIGALAPLTETGAPGGTSLVADAAARTLRRLVAGPRVTLDDASVPGQVRIGVDAAAFPDSLDALADAGSSADVLTLGVAATSAPGAVANVAVGPGALAAGGGALGNNTALGAAAGRSVSGSGNVAVGAHAGGGQAPTVGAGTNNTCVGRRAGAVVTDGHFNVFVGTTAGAKATTTTGNVGIGGLALSNIDVAEGGTSSGYNVAVGYGACRSARGVENVCLGYLAGHELTTGNRNILIGNHAGGVVSTGSGNVVIGGYNLGFYDISNTVVIADGQGNVVMCWENGANAAQRLDGVAPPLQANGTLCFVYNAAQRGLDALLRVDDTTHTLELTNGRPLAPDWTADALVLSVAQRNRLTSVTAAAAAVVTVAAYAGILPGAEHEFLHRGGATLTFAPDAGVTLLAAGDRRALAPHGVAVVKYLGSATFALTGDLLPL